MGYNVPIYKVPAVETRDKDGEHLRVLGEAFENPMKIHLAKGLTPERQRPVVLHEVIHLIDFFDHSFLMLREDQVSGLAQWLTLMLRDNPDFVRYLMEGA